MNPQWFGDSFDIVKRFFVENLREIGYHVTVDPMLTGEWNGLEKRFYKFLKADPLRAKSTNIGKSALLLDPDTGVGKRKTKRHVTINCIAEKLNNYDVVFSFDQSFSRGGDSAYKIREKLTMLKETGNHGLYFDSHARFLFASKYTKNLREIEKQILSTGLPKSRLFKI